MPRPRKPGLPIAGTIGAVALWGVVAHDSGVGWVQATGTLVAGILIVGLLGPLIAVSRASCRVVGLSHDVAAGQPIIIELATSGAVEISFGATRAVSGRQRRAQLVVVPAHRGMAYEMELTVASAAPFGMLWWTRSMVVALPRPIAVAPRTGAPDLGVMPPTEEDGRDVEAQHQLRGVRPYSAGDRLHLVHWRATAHTGALMVREVEPSGGRPRTLQVNLPDDPSAAERAAEHIMGVVAVLMAAGNRVEMATVEPDGPVTAPVHSLADAGRRLAAAVPRSSPW